MLVAARGYFRDSLEELKKVSWPSRARVIKLTTLVVVVSLVAALYLGLLDFVLLKLVSVFVKR